MERSTQWEYVGGGTGGAEGSFGKNKIIFLIEDFEQL
jgi:hypothetical protein